MSKKRRAKIPPFRVLNSENIFRKFVSKIMRSCDKNFAQLQISYIFKQMKYNIINKIEFAERSNFYETCSKQKIHIGKREYHPSSCAEFKSEL